MKEYQDDIQKLYKITIQDLKRVFDKYFAKFLEKDQHIAVVTTPAGDEAKAVQQAFADSKTFKFNQYALSDLETK